MAFRLQGTALAGIVGTTLMLTGAPARAADDGQANIFDAIMMLAGVDKGNDSGAIDYHERPPLVLPPKSQALRKPLPEGASRTAAWPKDPDVEARRKAAEDARAPRPHTLGNDKDLLSQEELRKGRGNTIASANGATAYACGEHERRCEVLDPDTLRAQGEAYDGSNARASGSENIVAGQEPGRDFLTQPPKGYRKATQTVKATQRAPEIKMDESNPKSQFIKRDPDAE